MLVNSKHRNRQQTMKSCTEHAPWCSLKPAARENDTRHGHDHNHSSVNSSTSVPRCHSRLSVSHSTRCSEVTFFHHPVFLPQGPPLPLPRHEGRQASLTLTGAQQRSVFGMGHYQSLKSEWNWSADTVPTYKKETILIRPGFLKGRKTHTSLHLISSTPSCLAQLTSEASMIRSWKLKSRRKCYRAILH